MKHFIPYYFAWYSHGIIKWAASNNVALTPRGKATSGYGGAMPVKKVVDVDFYTNEFNPFYFSRSVRRNYRNIKDIVCRL